MLGETHSLTTKLTIMEFLLQLIAELFGGETLNETENVVANYTQPVVEVDEQSPIELAKEELEETSVFGVMQFL